MLATRWESSPFVWTKANGIRESKIVRCQVPGCSADGACAYAATFRLSNKLAKLKVATTGSLTVAEPITFLCAEHLKEFGFCVTCGVGYGAMERDGQCVSCRYWADLEGEEGGDEWISEE